MKMKTNKTVCIVKNLNADEESRLIAEDRDKFLRDYYGEMDVQREKGERKGKIEMARNLLKYGVDLKVISKSSGLKLEEIQKLDENEDK